MNCPVCRLDISNDPWHYHDPIVDRCRVCGARCGKSLCAGCEQGITEPQLEEFPMVGTRIRRGHDA